MGFSGQHSCWAISFYALGFLGPFHSSSFLGPFSSSLPLSLPWVFAKSFGFPNPITTSLPFGFIGLYANHMNLLIPFLGFPDPFYFSPSLIILMGLLLHSISFLSPFAFFLATYYFRGPIDHNSHHFGLMIFALLFSLPIFFILLGFFCHWTLLSKMGINKYIM